MKVRTTAPVLFLASAAACAGRLQTPEDLAAAFDRAVERGDAAAAYALLAPEVQAHTSPKAFARRFSALRPTFRRARAELPSGARRVILAEVTTDHGDDVLLDWQVAGGRVYLVAGLPRLPRTDTPQAAVRSFVAALRAGPAPAIAGIVTPEFFSRLSEDWDRRAARIEAALSDPENLTVAADGSRAELRYGDGGSVRLVRTPVGWRIAAFQ